MHDNISMEKLLASLASCRIDIRFFTPQSIQMKFWIGAVLRNRFLYAADTVSDKHGVSLRQIIDTLPLAKSHFLYEQLRGGFPKGFLFDCSSLPYEAPGFTLEANQVYTFSLILIGNFMAYKPLFITAIQHMIEKGFGYPMVPMTLIDITDQDICRLQKTNFEKETIDLELWFKTPVNLLPSPKESNNGYQNKLNNFPSFYQFMRTLTYRAITLNLLYTDDPPTDSYEQMNNWIEQYISPSVRAILLQADLHYEKRWSTPKINSNNVYSMGGYTGKLIFGNVPAHYLERLRLASSWGIGAGIKYGLGWYQVMPYYPTKPKRP